MEAPFFFLPWTYFTFNYSYLAQCVIFLNYSGGGSFRVPEVYTFFSENFYFFSCAFFLTFHKLIDETIFIFSVLINSPRNGWSITGMTKKTPLTQTE